MFVVNKHCTIILYTIIDDVENRSYLLPLCMDIILPVNVNIVQDSRQFELKPNWLVKTPAMITAYKQELDELLTIYNSTPFGNFAFTHLILWLHYCTFFM